MDQTTVGRFSPCASRVNFFFERVLVWSVFSKQNANIYRKKGRVNRASLAVLSCKW